MNHEHAFPETGNHLLTPSEQQRVTLANDRMRQCARLVAAPPPPPVAPDGSATQTRAVISVWLADYESAASLNGTVHAIDTRLAALRTLVREAGLANPVGCGPHATTLAMGLRALPGLDDKLPDGSAKYASPAAWLVDYRPAVGALIASIEPAVRGGYRA